MLSSANQSKGRLSIFKNNLFLEAPVFKKVPIHFDFNPSVTYVMDHTNQTITTSKNILKNKRSNSHNKIFGERKTYSQQKNLLSSVQQTSRCASFCGDRNRNHNIFSNKKQLRLTSEQDALVFHQDHGKQIQTKLFKTQSEPERLETTLAVHKNIEIQKQKLEGAKKQKQENLSVNSTIQHQVQQNQRIDIMRPQQFARMLKQARVTTKKSKRNHQIIYPIPKVLSQVPYHQNFYEAKRKQKLIYKI